MTHKKRKQERKANGKDGTARTEGAQIQENHCSRNYLWRDVGLNGLPTPDELEGVECPPVDEFMKAKQKDGTDMEAERVYKATYLWLKKKGCDKLVAKQLVQQYAMSVARWIQCENALSTYGFLAKHPTTSAAIASPYVLMGQTYMKQINATWFQIYQIVKDNGSAGMEELDDSDIMMEALLKTKKR